MPNVQLIQPNSNQFHYLFSLISTLVSFLLSLLLSSFVSIPISPNRDFDRSCLWPFHDKWLNDAQIFVKFHHNEGQQQVETRNSEARQVVD